MKTTTFLRNLLTAALLCSSLETWAEPAKSEPVQKGQRIYASHHSYFAPVPALLKEIAQAAGYTDQVIVGSRYIGGSTSMQHWNLPDAENKAKEVLNAGGADVLILTPIYLPDPGIGNFARLGLEHNPGIRVTAMEFWLPFDVYNPTIYNKQYVPQPGEPPLMPKPAKVDHNLATGKSLREMHAYYFRKMDEEITRVNHELGRQVVFVVPMGQAVIALREKILAGQAPGLKTQDDLFTDQLGHPKPPLAVLEAYCHYAVIYRKSPVGLPVPSILAKMNMAEGDKEALNRLLQELAWEAATHHPLSGVSR